MKFQSSSGERTKIIFYLIIIFVIATGILLVINYRFLVTLNEHYINQNTEIMGDILSRHPELEEDIVSIMMGKREGNYELGKQILSQYSYEKDLGIALNPLLKGVTHNSFLLVIGFIIVLFLCVTVAVILMTNPLYNEINRLTKRAEKIVEGDFSNEEPAYLAEGILYKFTTKFNVMEKRIENNISLLNAEKMNLKNIINDISHQLKTPLAALTMYNEILTDHENMEKSEVTEFIKLSKEQLERMDWLVKTLLKYARLESNVVQYKKEIYPLSRTLEESLSSLRVKATQKKQHIVFQQLASGYYSHDRNWLHEAFSNIIKNAIEHTAEFGEIEVGIEETPLSIIIVVKDNGEGIEPENLRRIFDRFYKGENSINPTSIGIGLALSKSIVEAHHGDITVESEVGVGTTFYINFLKSVF